MINKVAETSVSDRLEVARSSGIEQPLHRRRLSTGGAQRGKEKRSIIATG
jgi:hypothetical protein